MPQFLVNLRWLPSLISLAMRNRIGVRRKKGHLYLYVDSSREVERGFHNLIKIEIGPEASL